jgi:hypothetical protein
VSRFVAPMNRIFDRMVEGEDGCWVWTGMLNGRGYGLVKHLGRRLMVHRVAYELMVTEIPDGLFLDHLCRVRACANPYHLDPVTNATNLLRGEGFGARNSRKTKCANGHPLVGANLLVSGGQRICRTCKRARGAARRERLRSAA